MRLAGRVALVTGASWMGAATAAALAAEGAAQPAATTMAQHA